MGYWRAVARRAWEEAAKVVKLDSRKLLMVLLLGQIANAVLLVLFLGTENLPENLWARAAAFASPFLLFVPFFLWEFFATPPKMHAEQLADRAAVELARSTELGDLRSTVGRLSDEIAALKAPRQPSRDPDGIYQHGTLVGQVRMADKQLARGVVIIGQISAGGDFARDDPFEYHDLLLRLESCASESSISGLAAEHRQSFNHAVCQVLGRV